MKSIYYNHRLEEIDEIILKITIATRYARCGRVISERFKKELETTISKAKTLNLQQYGFIDEESKIFYEDLGEVESLI